MIQRELDGCLNPYKHHLWRLPDIPVDRQPEPYQADSTRFLVVFPLFQTRPDDISLEHHIVRAACWARRSWLLFSDAIEMRIKIGFYVGDTVLDRVAPILEANGIDVDNNVFLLHEAPFEGEPITHLGKKLSVFNDSQFADYDWVLQMDCDMFLASPSRKRGEFFGCFREHADAIGAVKTSVEKSVISEYHWYNYLIDTDSEDKAVAEWVDRAGRLVNEKVLEKYIIKELPIVNCHGGIYAFPAKYFSSAYPEAGKWLAKAGQLLQDDEAVFSLWATRGDTLFNISETVGIRFCTDLHLLERIHKAADPLYLSHIGHIHDEWLWREGFDGI